jgi:RNA polymerase sigma-70 factor (ECF subfamily)
MRLDGEGSEQDLVRRAKAGDEAAFGELFDRHAGDVAAVVRRRIAPALLRKTSISDVLQETRIVAFAKCAAFEDRGDGAFRAWILGIAEMHVRRTLRHYGADGKRAAGREVTRGARGETAGFAARGPSPSEVAIADELQATALRVLGTLPDHYREVLQLTQFEGLTLRDAGVRMGRSHEAVKKLYGRAMTRFAAAAGINRRRTR